MNEINFLILAAGKSSRISAFANGLPKPLIPINGIEVLKRNLLWLNSFGVENVWINKHYKSDIFESFFEKIDFIEIKSFLEEDLRGTAGSVREASRLWEDKKLCVVVYGDNLYNFNLLDLIERHKKFDSKFTIAAYDKNNVLNSGISSGRIIESKGKVLQFVENGNDCHSDLVNAGVYIFSSELISMIPEKKFYDFGIDFFPVLLKKKITIQLYKIEGYCLAIDDPKALRNTEKILLGTQ